MRVAVATAGYGNPWNEEHALVSRLAGAIACGAEVDLIVAEGTQREVARDGACRLLRFPASPSDPSHRRAWRRAMLGVEPEADLMACTCRSGPSYRHEPLPALAEEQLVLAEGGDSPELYEHLHDTPYDLTVFVGAHSPVTCFGMRSLPDSRRVVLVPGGPDAATLWLRLHDETFERPERVLVCTEAERARIMPRLGSGGASRVENLGFLVRVNPVARASEPYEFEARPWLVVARDWTGTAGVDHLLRWAERLAEEVHPDLRLGIVGPGAEHIPNGLRLTSSRLDAWRWMSRALAVLDPTPHRLVGREVLEAMLFGTPVIVHARGDATREHAEVGNGGLWYRTDEELYGVVRALLDEEVRIALGGQGGAYAEERFSDTDRFIKKIDEVLLS